MEVGIQKYVSKLVMMKTINTEYYNIRLSKSLLEIFTKNDSVNPELDLGEGGGALSYQRCTYARTTTPSFGGKNGPFPSIYFLQSWSNQGN